MSRSRGAVPRRERELKRRRLLRWLRAGGVAALLLAALCGLALAVETALQPDRFPIRSVSLSGDLDDTRLVELRPQIERYWGRNILTADIDGLRAQLLANPWLRQVSIRRAWPDSLHVSLRLRRVFGRWGERELIDTRGERFLPPGETLPAGVDWPQLGGPDGQERYVMNSYRRAQAVVAPLGLRIVELRQDRRLSWRLRFANGVRLVFSKDDLGNGLLMTQLRRFAGVYRRLAAELDLARIETVDLRYPGGFSIRWNDTRKQTQEQKRVSARARAHVGIY